eukprot:1427131-Rhodomonas_salina.2
MTADTERLVLTARMALPGVPEGSEDRRARLPTGGRGPHTRSVGLSRCGIKPAQSRRRTACPGTEGASV